MLRQLFDALFPPQCAACSAVGSGLCERCLPSGGGIERRLATLHVRALGTYDGALRSAILAVKDGRRDVALALGTRMGALYEPAHYWVPVPSSRARVRARGIDGVRFIAQTAAGESACIALQRAGSDAQRGRSRTERVLARGRFVCTRDVRGRTLVLCDDVCTTGSTLEDCARELRAAGARVDTAVVVALA
ncbi:MAG: ComF family protein [Vulcanimicrobiaceae bacterium]